LDDVFSEPQANDIINIQVEHVSVDSTTVIVHPDGTGALNNTTSLVKSFFKLKALFITAFPL
jgi:lactam utilization protein B